MADAPKAQVGEWRRKDDGALIRVMAQAEGWAMVRRKGCIPFVLMVKELRSEYTEEVSRG